MRPTKGKTSSGQVIYFSTPALRAASSSSVHFCLATAPGLQATTNVEYSKEEGSLEEVSRGCDLVPLKHSSVIVLKSTSDIEHEYLSATAMNYISIFKLSVAFTKSSRS